MNNLPDGWNEQYALRWAVERITQLIDAVNAADRRMAELEAELARLDVTKADRRGRKPATAHASKQRATEETAND